MNRIGSALAAIALLYVLAPSAASAANACGSHCVKSALVTPTANSAKIVVETRLKTNITVVVREPNGGPSKLVARSNGIQSKFVTNATGLKPSTTYDIRVKAVDTKQRAERRYGFFKTLKAVPLIEPVGGGNLGANVGCAAQCILSASATPSLNNAKLDIKASAPVKLTITAAREAPLPTSLGPMFKDPEVTLKTNSFKQSWSGKLEGLKESSAYHVVVRATDQQGKLGSRTGTLTTLTRHVRVHFKRIRVTYDAEKGANRGEIRFAGVVNGEVVTTRGEDKIQSDSTVHFSHDEFTFAAMPRLLELRVQGRERDHRGFGFCFDSTGDLMPGISGSRNEGCNGWTWDTAVQQLDLGAEANSQNALPPGYGGASMYNLEVTDSGRSALNFRADFGVDVWAE